MTSNIICGCCSGFGCRRQQKRHTAAPPPASNSTMEVSSERPGKMDSCLISSVSTAAIPKAHRYPFGSLKYPLLRESIPRMHGASGPVTMGCFCQSCPVRLTSASNTLSFWDSPVTPEMQMDSDPLKSDGIKVHCASVSTRALYSCGSDVPGHRVHIDQ